MNLCSYAHLAVQAELVEASAMRRTGQAQGPEQP
jgi:hypothetical protein